MRNWEKKLHIMQQLSESELLHMRSPGDWVCSLPGEIGGGGFLTSTHFDGSSPEEAVKGAWDMVVCLPQDRHLRVGGIDGMSYRWDVDKEKFIKVCRKTSKPL